MNVTKSKLLLEDDDEDTDSVKLEAGKE